MDRDLDSKVAFVTGAARGIGNAIAKRLAAAGATVIACDLDVEAPASIGPPITYLACDVTDSEAVEALVAGVVQKHDGLDILVNNAGIAVDGLLLRCKTDDWHRVMDTNLTGAFNCCRASARHLLRARDSGRIVNIASVVGERGNKGQVAYAASKAGIVGLTRALAVELGSRGVTVNAVSPGYIDTDMTRQRVTPEAKEILLASTPLRRLGTPDDVAEAVWFLCSPKSAFITGQVLRVNGGLHL